jgi:hypothetical protein
LGFATTKRSNPFSVHATQGDKASISTVDVIGIVTKTLYQCKYGFQGNFCSQRPLHRYCKCLLTLSPWCCIKNLKQSFVTQGGKAIMVIVIAIGIFKKKPYLGKK